MDTRIAYRTATEEFSQALHLNIHKSNFIKRATTIMLDLLKKGNHITKIDRALKNAAIKSKHRQKIEKWGYFYLTGLIQDIHKNAIRTAGTQAYYHGIAQEIEAPPPQEPRRINQDRLNRLAISACLANVDILRPERIYRKIISCRWKNHPRWR